MTDILQTHDGTKTDNDPCRICLSTSDLIIPIFNGKGVEYQLLEKIQKYLPVTISETDLLPQQICNYCTSTLLAWDTLYNDCLKTDEKLKLLASGKKPSDRVEEIKGIKIGNVGKNSSIDDAEENNERLDKRQVMMHERKQEMSSRSDKVIHENSAQGAYSSTIDKDVMLSMLKNDCQGDNSSESTNVTSKPVGSGALPSVTCDKISISLDEHRRDCHGSRSIAPEDLLCKICNTRYKTRANLKRHQQRDHLTDQIECFVCHESINSKKLNAHLKMVHGVKADTETSDRFKCQFCEKWFKNKYVRNSHEKEVHLSEPVQCKLCDFKGTQTVLKRHKRYVHVEKRFLCSLCPGAFKTLHTLKLHMTSHSDIRCYTCDICGMGFKRLNNVRDHMKCHEKKSNQCQICGNFFARKRYLAIHEKTIHNFYADGVVPEEKGFECEICGAKLKWKKNLLAHMRIHTGEKPYVCKICNKNFNCHGTLRTHMTKHDVFNEMQQEPVSDSSQAPFGDDATTLNALNPRPA